MHALTNAFVGIETLMHFLSHSSRLISSSAARGGNRGGEVVVVKVVVVVVVMVVVAVAARHLRHRREVEGEARGGVGGEDRLQRAELLAQVEDPEEALRLRLVEQRHRAHHRRRLELPEPREEGGSGESEARNIGKRCPRRSRWRGSRRGAGGRHLRGGVRGEGGGSEGRGEGGRGEGAGRGWGDAMGGPSARLQQSDEHQPGHRLRRLVEQELARAGVALRRQPEQRGGEVEVEPARQLGLERALGRVGDRPPAVPRHVRPAAQSVREERELAAGVAPLAEGALLGSGWRASRYTATISARPSPARRRGRAGRGGR